MLPATLDVILLIAAVLMIVGLKGLTHPRTAVRGNLISAVGMLLAILATLVHFRVVSYGGIIVGLGLGSALGYWLAVRTKMEGMPQMVALLNGLGGAASLLVGGAELHFAISKVAAARIAADAAWKGIPGAVRRAEETASTAFAFPMGSEELWATIASGLIGGVTLLGSLVAWAKLSEEKWVEALPRFENPKLINSLLGGGCLVLGLLLSLAPEWESLYWLLTLAALALGYGLTIGIGGADMPVVIALLNSYSGLAGAATGFVLNSHILIIAGSLVGASGVLLTREMCRAMNRSLQAVLFGTLAPSDGAKKKQSAENVRATSADEVAMLFDSAERVVIVPGYGLAVAQAQHALRDLARLLEDRGAKVVFGIHPVAGRMPGHMNVLLAEADVPYDQLKEMDEVNADMEQTDVCLVVGANDTVNPDARTNPNSPIAGMPIINADKARFCVVVKRSLSPGFAGIPNPLFAAPNCLMMFADGKQGMTEIIAALKQSR